MSKRNRSFAEAAGDWQQLNTAAKTFGGKKLRNMADEARRDLGKHPAVINARRQLNNAVEQQNRRNKRGIW